MEQGSSHSPLITSCKKLMPQLPSCMATVFTETEVEKIIQTYIGNTAQTAPAFHDDCGPVWKWLKKFPELH